ncbi:MAG: hypothetical protein QOH05_1950 [Acetobacteraceae bacterium]|jgi:hypothetical protein|nr:hypothetical protein [Acetobacteraceae bacterium]
MEIVITIKTNAPVLELFALVKHSEEFCVK